MGESFGKQRRLDQEHHDEDHCEAMNGAKQDREERHRNQRATKPGIALDGARGKCHEGGKRHVQRPDVAEILQEGAH